MVCDILSSIPRALCIHKPRGIIHPDCSDADDPRRIVTLSLSDVDFDKLVKGESQAQRLFMAGKLRVKGNVMKATKMEPILKKAQTKAKL